MNVSNRNLTIDFIRGFSIILVVFSHLAYSYPVFYNDNEWYIQFFQYIHMPLFFFCSGFVSAKSLYSYKFFSIFKQKFIRLVMPYLIWSSIALLMNYLLLFKNGHTNILEYKKIFVEIFIYSESMWFLISLFASILLVKFIIILKSKNFLLFCFVLIAIILFPLEINIFSINKVQELFVVFCFGVLFKKEYFNKIGNNKVFLLFIFLSFSLFILLGRYVTLNTFNLWSLEILLKILLDCLGIITFGIICVIISKKKFCLTFISHMGLFSLEIYCIHMMFIKYIKIPLPENVFSDNILAVGILIIITIIIIILSIYIAKIIKKIYILDFLLWGNNRRKK